MTPHEIAQQKVRLALASGRYDKKSLAQAIDISIATLYRVLNNDPVNPVKYKTIHKVLAVLHYIKLKNAEFVGPVKPQPRPVKDHEDFGDDSMMFWGGLHGLGFQSCALISLDQKQRPAMPMGERK